MAPAEIIEKKDEEKETEDSALIKDLKALSDSHLEIDKEHEKEIQAIRRKYEERQKPLLEERSKVLLGDGADQDLATGTPALPGFWAKALKHHPDFSDEIESYDMPVLEYLRDIQFVDLDPDDSDKGFRLKFHFAPNPYFENAVLSKEYHTKPASNPYCNDGPEVVELRSSAIDWKDGKDVTVEKVKVKKKGFKNRGNKDYFEPRSSFFRSFMNLKEGGELPEGFDEDAMMALGVDDEEEAMEELLNMDYSSAWALREKIIPYAVRWYTGEAAPEDDYDEDGEEDDDDDDDEDESEEAPPAKGKKGGSKKKTSGDAAEGGQKQEECKQQ
eukprot:TRINITY_DN2271_c0_g2_i1.p1 TRINITY_DN2271_c0_g2~~TRINITY_DN2271_c0_g2_i1.p1  ORF type:complete len:357 (-),score=110.46 TRINITY_DN2271_c0_g2_i1:420-1406(-)